MILSFEETRQMMEDGITDMERRFAKMTQAYDQDFTDSRRLLTG